MNEAVWKIIDQQFKDNYQTLVSHQTESYEHFFNHDIFKIFREKNPLVLGSNYDKRKDEFANECRMYFGGKDGSAIYYGKPCIYDDLGFHYMYPNEARLKNMTYGMTIHYDVEVEFITRGVSKTSGSGPAATSSSEDIEQAIREFQAAGGAKKAQRRKGEAMEAPDVDVAAMREEVNGDVVKRTVKLEKMFLGRFPVMLQSKYCILRDLPREMRFALGECKNDVGGYFIIEGKEKTVVCQEKFADNMVYVRATPEGDKFSHIANVRSISENAAKPQRTLSVSVVAPTDNHQNGQVVVNIPNVRAPIPLFILFRALGVTSDKDIIRHCLLDMEAEKDMVDLFAPSVYDAATTFTQRAALRYIATFTKYTTIEYIHEILSDYLLPHIGETNYKEKALFLGTMARDVLRVSSGRAEPTDRDSFRFKRIELPGSLIYDLFREYYTMQLKTIHLEFEKRLMLNKSMYENNLPGLIQQYAPTVFAERVLEEGFRKGFKGNWGATAHTKRIGVVQDLNYLSHPSMISHLRKTNLPLDASVKVVGPRVLHGSQWGYFDPIDTPDGGNIGLHKHLSICTYISRAVDRDSMTKWVLENTEVEPIESFELENMYAFTKVFVNGYWLGMVREPTPLVEKFRLFRRNGLLPTYVSIGFDMRAKTVYIYCDAGRVCRPLFYQDGDEMSFERKGVADKLAGEVSWTDLLVGFNKRKDGFAVRDYGFYKLSELYGTGSEENPNKLQRFLDDKAIIDYVDNNECEGALIALDEEQRKKGDKKYTHMEIHPSTIMGVMGSMIPYPENNPASRNSFSCGQSKQATSIYHTNYQMRMDKSAIVLNNGQVPLVKTRYLKHINNEENVYGENAIVAIMTYTSFNVEDAILINEGALDRGLFRTTYFTTYEAHEEHEHNGDSTTLKAFGPIASDASVRGTKPGFDYTKLDESGLIREGSLVNEETALIGATTSVSNIPGKRDASKMPKKGQLGVVDRAFITEGEEGKRIAKVRVREVRIPNLGDKFASRAGQKGTVGLVIPECDMPFTQDGIRPDIIVNPHAIPSRMTIGHLVEAIMGKAGATMGGFADGTAFINKGSKVEVFGRVLQHHGFHPSGNEIMYNGMTGEQIEAAVFTGPTYYMRLKHMVKDKINYRGRGPRNVLTRQTVAGRANDGGLRIGEMERDGLLSHGMSAFVFDSMMERGDRYKIAVCNKTGAMAIYNEEKDLFFSPMADGPVTFNGSLENDNMRMNVISRFGRDFSIVEVPYTFKLMMQELMAMNVQLRIITDANIEHINSMKASDNFARMTHQDASDERALGVAHLISTREVMDNAKPMPKIEWLDKIAVGDKVSVPTDKEGREWTIKALNPLIAVVETGPDANGQYDTRDVKRSELREYTKPPSDDTYKEGDVVYLKGDAIPGREWVVKATEDEDVIIEAKDSTGLDNPIVIAKQEDVLREEPPFSFDTPELIPDTVQASPDTDSPGYAPDTNPILEPAVAAQPEPRYAAPPHDFKVGETVNFRGDFKAGRAWTITKSGPKFLTIFTADRAGLAEGNETRIVTPLDVSRPGDFPMADRPITVAPMEEIRVEPPKIAMNVPEMTAPITAPTAPPPTVQFGSAPIIVREPTFEKIVMDAPEPMIMDEPAEEPPMPEEPRTSDLDFSKIVIKKTE